VLAADRFAPFNQKAKGVAQYLASLVDLVAGVSYIAKPTASEREVPAGFGRQKHSDGVAD
jgi:hypothetical protein